MSQESKNAGKNSGPNRIPAFQRSSEIYLPDFKSTEEAVRFGQHITRDQYIFLSGALAALNREFNEGGLRAETGFKVALRTQLISEALEVAPDLVLASL